MDARPVVGRHVRTRGRPEPHIVVEVRGNRLDRRVTTGLVAANANLDALDVADAAVRHELAHKVELRLAALPGTDLHHAVPHLREIRDDAALGDRLGERLLQPDVLARGERRARDEGVPVVGDADLDGVDGRIEQHVVVVGVGLDGIVRILLVEVLHELDTVREALRVEVADRGDAAEVPVLGDERHVHRRGDASDADDADVDFLVRGERAHAAGAAGEDERNRERRGGAEELTTTEFHVLLLDD